MSRISFALVVVCVISLIAGGSSQRSVVRAQVKAGGLDALKVLAGTWKADGEAFDTEFSKASKDTSTLHNDCWQSGEFYACDQIVDGVSRALIVFSLSEKDGTFNNYAIQAGGAPAGPGGILTISGNTWTYAPRQNADAKPPFFRTVNVFDGSSTIHYKIEFTRDNQTWTKTREGIERRVN